MRVGLIGRTKWLIDTAKELLDSKIDIAFILHGKAADHDKITDEDFEKIAQKAQCPLYSNTHIDDELCKKLKTHQADLALSVNWAFILKKEVIDIFPKGIINAHAGDLPRYRGNACPNWAILNGEDHIGLSMQMMIPDEVDAGPVVLKEKFPIHHNTYIEDIYNWLDKKIPKMLVTAGKGVFDGSIEAQPQNSDPALALRCYPRRPEDGQINWRDSAEKVHRLIRASGFPFSGAFTHYEGKHKIIIHRAAIFHHPTEFLAVPGQILLNENNQPVIACGEGCLLLSDLSWDGNDCPTVLPEEYLSKHLRGRLYSR